MNNVEAIRRIEQLEKQKIFNLDGQDKEAIVIQETIYLGKINNKDLFRLAELDNRDNYSSVIYKYFDENAKLQGVKNVRPDGEIEWVYLEEEWEQLKDEIDKNEAQLQEEIEQILAELGISRENIDNITEVDLQQKVREKEEEDEELEEDVEQQEKSKDSKDEKKIKIEQTSEYNNVLNEVDTGKYIDQKGTELGEALGLDEYGYTKLLIVHSDNVRDIKDANGKYENAPTKRLAILGVREKDGKKVVEKIPEDILDYYRGTNENSIRFDDNDEVEKNMGTYERFVNPKTNRGIAIEKGEMQTKVYYQGGIDREDNTAVMERVEDGHTGWINAQTKEIFNSNHGIYHKDKINDEMEIHDKDNGEEINRKNADGDLETISGHIHEIDENSEIIYNGRLMSVQEVAQMPEFKVSAKHFVELYNARIKEQKGKDDISIDKLYDDIEEDVNAELEGPRTR